MIELPRRVYDGLVDHARDGAPAEACGVLGGTYDPDRSIVTAFHPADNASSTPETEYAIDPAEQLAVIETIEDAGDDVCGFYHSHPAGPPEPSETDAERAAWPGLSYVIVVLEGRHPYVGSWRWDGDGGRFDQEVLCVR